MNVIDRDKNVRPTSMTASAAVRQRTFTHKACKKLPARPTIPTGGASACIH